jgi:transglutaminase-like putative cysteine protease
MEKTTTKKYIFVILLLVVVYLSFLNKGRLMNNNTSNEPGMDWQTEYVASANEQLSSYSTNIQNTDYYDFNDPIILNEADKIAKESASEKQAIEKTLDYVYSNIEYVEGESDEACYSGKAPNILRSGNGQCDTMSIVVISMLRKMGIAAKPVGGCVVINDQCKLQALFASQIGGIIRLPRFSRENNVEIDSSSTTFSRKGYLHAWVTAWIPEQGWVDLESTSGMIADTSCYSYYVELFPKDENKDDICVSKSYAYAKACQISNVEGLNTYGLGNSLEVEP